MSTYGQMLDKVGTVVPPHLEAQAEVPVLDGVQRQGDLLVVPCDQRADGVPVGAGVQVMVGEATGNTHWLHGDGIWEQVDDGQVVGRLTVPDGGAAFLVHTDEHGANGIGAGSFEVRRKREWAAAVRQVAD